MLVNMPPFEREVDLPQAKTEGAFAYFLSSKIPVNAFSLSRHSPPAPSRREPFMYSAHTSENAAIDAAFVE